ncbi:MAG: hypothetical protein KGI19_09240 [Thaumarchaeota archaeon]|nr:hypothetical protein [Nitrososphaerota archaeon]
MKTLHLGIIIILGTSLGVSTQVAFADDTNGVQIQNIQVKPPIIKVGDNFNITATLVNNSTDTISVHNDCLAPFSVTFSHATIDVEKPCIYFAISKFIKPGENITVSGPGSNIAYLATDAGVANATITFSYTDENQTNSNTSANPSIISKSILFTILSQSTQTTSAMLDPLQQFKSGIFIQDIKCRQDFQLIMKSEDNTPACVTSNTANILLERGWAELIPNRNTQTTDTKNYDPFGITALVIYKPSAGCLIPPSNTTLPVCPPNNFYLKINSNSTAYLLGYNICDGDSCVKNNDLSVLLPINSGLKPDYQMIGLPVNLQWNDGDTTSIQLVISSTDNKTKSQIDIENSTIVPQ